MHLHEIMNKTFVIQIQYLIDNNFTQLTLSFFCCSANTVTMETLKNAIMQIHITKRILNFIK